MKRHQREGRAPWLMVIIERIIPPRAVLLLQRHDDAGEVPAVTSGALSRQQVRAKCGVVMAVIKKVARDEEP